MKVIDGDLEPAATAKSSKAILWAEIQCLQTENSQLMERITALEGRSAVADNASIFGEYQLRLIRDVLSLTGKLDSHGAVI